MLNQKIRIVILNGRRIISRHFRALLLRFINIRRQKKNTYATYASKVQNFRRISLIADISVHVTGHDIICRNWNSFVTF